MKNVRPIIALVLMLGMVPAVTQAQSAGPVATVRSPVVVSELFVINWHDGWKLGCLTFSNASDREIHAIRFGLSYAQDNPLGDGPSQRYIDRIGTFAPGVAIRAPTRFLGTVAETSPALENCWRVAGGSDIATVLGVSILKVVYADGTVWVNPNPSQTLATTTY
jgi:hypothetical protein